MPISVRTEVWSDLNENLVSDALGEIKKSINLDAVKTSINNILMTNKGERVFLPQFGGGINNLLFEPVNETLAQQVADAVKQAIEVWDPRVRIQGVDTQVYADDNQVNITVRYAIVGYAEAFATTVSMIP